MRARLAIEWSRDERPAVLVPALDAIALTHGSGHRALSRGETRWLFERAWRRDRFPFRRFADAAELTERSLFLLDDDSLRALFIEAIELGSLVGLRPEEVPKTPSETSRRRALLRELEGLARGLLALRGERYHVVTDVDLERLPDRREFDVVPRAKAEAVLEELARLHRGRFAALLTEVRKKLTADWAAPLTPDGFILLRLRPLVRLHAQVDAPKVTPSQLKALAKSQETTWIEVVLEDQDGEPVADCAVVIRHESGLCEQGRTDEKGVLRLDPTEAGKVTIEFPDYLDESSWQDLSPLEGQLAEGESGAVEVPDEAEEEQSNDSAASSDEAAGVPDAAAPETEQVADEPAPYFRCNEIAGVHFAFAKSFVESSGLEPLAAIVAELLEDEQRKGMVFGHTDIAGSEEANKALSERRAKAVRALLTHDAGTWDELWAGRADGPHWHETWGIREAQHMLNAVGARDDQGQALEEDGLSGPKTRKALANFQAGACDHPRPGSSPLPETGELDDDTRKELFLAYASLVPDTPLEDAKLASVGNSPFMGCGEYNPLSDKANDVGSRRTVVFVFDPEAAPSALPCALGDVDTCRAHCKPPEEQAPMESDHPYRCEVYRRLARNCICQAGEELMPIRVQLHDPLCGPLATIPFRLFPETGAPVAGQTDASGWLHAAVPKAKQRLRIRYRPQADMAEQDFHTHVVPSDGEEGDVYTAHIKNFGFCDETEDDANAIVAFQAACGLEMSGELDDTTRAAVDSILDKTMREELDSNG